MIALSPGSLCDVCAEEYGPHNYPHSIPCGHILCLNCCNNIVDKSSPKRAPCCPFCREAFTSDSVRIMRVDYTPSSSGWSTPRRGAGIHDVIIESDGEDALSAGLRSREQAKRLESKVARVAGKKCSVEEVSTLHRELQDWLSSKVKPREQTSSLELSAALLRAILMNYHAHSEATKAAKQMEAQLSHQLEETEMKKTKLEAELRSLRADYSQLAQECQSLRSEANRSKVKSSAPLLNVPTTPPPRSYASLQGGGPLSPPRPQTAAPPSSDPRSRATSPTSPTPYSHAAPIHSPLTYKVTNSLHARSASVQPTSVGHRSTTPAIRSATPASPIRAELRSRRTSVSTPSPLKMVRSTSSGSSADEIQIQKDSHKERERESERRWAEREKDTKHEQFIQRWLPDLQASSPPTEMLGTYFIPPSAPRSPPPLIRSRTISTANVAAAQAHSRLATPFRYKTPVSATPS